MSTLLISFSDDAPIADLHYIINEVTSHVKEIAPEFLIGWHVIPIEKVRLLP